MDCLKKKKQNIDTLGRYWQQFKNMISSIVYIRNVGKKAG